MPSEATLRLCFLLLVAVLADGQDGREATRRVTVPPLIEVEPAQEMAFRIGESLEMPCVASGEPEPIYSWQMNEQDFDPSGTDGRIATQPGSGTLIFANPLERDEALYQCFAENQVGIALTVKINLRQAYLDSFSDTNTDTHKPYLGHPLTLLCIPPHSYPRPEIFWATIAVGETFTPIDLTTRITIDPEGNLYFANIQPQDEMMGRTYTCIVQNQVMREVKQGEYAQIKPQGQHIQNLPPEILWASPTQQVALRGEEWRIKCIFSGSPTPRVDWHRHGKDMPESARQESFRQELVVPNLQFEDEGTYECQGLNDEAVQPIRRSFELSIESKPFWTVQPESVDAAEGDDVVFECFAEAIPDPEYYWFLNGVPISKVPADPDRIVEKNRITFKNMSKEDAQVVQCNATNKHGYIFQNAYLNVLMTEPPLIEVEPAQEMAFRIGESLEMPCVASGHPEPIYSWQMNEQDFDPSGTDGRIVTQPGSGTLIFVNPLERDEALYQCFAENQVGIALTVKTNLREAYLDSFSYTQMNVHKPYLGHPLTLHCIPPRSYPQPEIFWATIAVGETFTPIDLTNRITIDPEGNLHFANIQPIDEMNGRLYTCIVQNQVLREVKQGEYAQIKPQGQHIQNLPPEILWTSPTQQVALRGEEWRIKCIFSGSPTPRVDWERQGKDMPESARQESFGQELVVPNLQFEDEGKYECQGLNDEALQPIRRSFELSIESKPFWTAQPESVDAAEGDDAVFECFAEAIPDPEYYWFLNGVPISKVPADPDRIVEKNRITFKNVSKEDAQVVQCNATNKHGYIFQNAYLNVLRADIMDRNNISVQVKTNEASECDRCESVTSNDQCTEIQECNIRDYGGCQTEVRTDGAGQMRITKKCQNYDVCMFEAEKHEQQCTGHNVPHSICYYCCDGDRCNSGLSGDAVSAAAVQVPNILTVFPIVSISFIGICRI